jgi:hypothetical protein
MSALRADSGGDLIGVPGARAEAAGADEDEDDATCGGKSRGAPLSPIASESDDASEDRSATTEAEGRPCASDGGDN